LHVSHFLQELASCRSKILVEKGAKHTSDVTSVVSQTVKILSSKNFAWYE